MTNKNKQEEIAKKLENYASLFAGKQVHVTNQDVFYPSLRNISPSTAVTDGSRIYLPSMNAETEEQEKGLKRMCLEKALEIKDGVYNNKTISKLREYDKEQVASSLFQVLENESYHEKAKKEMPNLYEGTKENEFLKNFVGFSNNLPQKEGKRLRKAASRFSQLAKSGKANADISLDYTKRVYNLIENYLQDEKEKNNSQNGDMKDLMELLKQFGFNPQYGDGKPIQKELKEYGDERDKIIAKYGNKCTNAEKKELENKLDKALGKTYGKGGDKDMEKAAEELSEEYKPEFENVETILEKEIIKWSNRSKENYHSFLKDYKCQVESLKQIFEKLKGAARKKLRRQESGNELDLDAAVNYIISLKSKEVPESEIYVDVKNNNRDVCVGLLLDTSGSTSGRVLESIKACTGILSEALEHIGDKYMIYSFAGESLGEVKGANENIDSMKGRLFNLNSGGGTPQAEATRDMTKIFGNIGAKTKILITISDGECDVEDTRKAILEAKEAGIKPYCITVDTDAKEYFPQLYADTPYCICEDPNQLPQKAGNFYKEVAF